MVYFIAKFLDFATPRFFLFTINLTFLILTIICVIVFNLRNLNRINNEMSLSENSANNFSNFPFYWVKDVKYKELKRDTFLLNQVESGNSCWATPSVCVTGTGDRINVLKKNNFIIYYFK